MNMRTYNKIAVAVSLTLVTLWLIVLITRT